jgi:hypothetical protein
VDVQDGGVQPGLVGSVDDQGDGVLGIHGDGFLRAGDAVEIASAFFKKELGEPAAGK